MGSSILGSTRSSHNHNPCLAEVSLLPQLGAGATNCISRSAQALVAEGQVSPSFAADEEVRWSVESCILRGFTAA